ncbi:lysozyme [Thioclava litoralis]|uniref:Lysozyme n=1 Tax=Thioclava litoralis TaxID=3076557 RepID=A0ABZ1DYS1_9RHOB|nr:lysozyme [Thioclava sp. FTW29]
MKLIPDARRVLVQSFAFWFTVMGLLVLLVPEVVYALTGLDMDPYVKWKIAVGLLIAGTAGRLVRQTSRAWVQWLRMLAVAALIIIFAVQTTWAAASSRPLVAGAQTSEVQILDQAVPFLEVWEGVELVAYRDIVGVWTICSGTTRGVVAGMRKTRAECAQILRAEALEYWRGTARFMTRDTLATRITTSRGVAWTSFAINVGIASAGGSTAMRRLNAGDILGSCKAMTWWNRAGQRVVAGLVNRREKGEYPLCIA